MKPRSLVAFLAAALLAPAWSAPGWQDGMRALQQAALHSDYAWRQVAALSDGIGPRLSGSPQAAEAVEHVAAQMRALGLHVELEPVMVPHWVRGEEKAELVDWPAHHATPPQKLVVTALGGSVATPPDGLTADVVVVRSEDELKRRTDVRGKIVVFDVPFDAALAGQGYGLEAYENAVGYRVDGASWASRQGAVAELVRSVGSADYRLPHTGVMAYDATAPRIPSGALAAEDADLLARLSAQGPLRMHLLLTPHQGPDVPSFNVIGDLPGRDRADEIVLVSGHLDSWDLGTGAIDDGAGVAVALETAHLMQQLHLQPSRTVRVVAWMNEENGGRGSKAYRADHEATLAKHYAAIESDLGAGRPAGFTAHVSPAGMKALEDVQEVLAEGGAPVFQPSYEPGGADVSPLDRAGVPTFGVLQDSRSYFAWHHTAADTLDKIVPRELQQNAAAVSALTWALANLDASLRF